MLRITAYTNIAPYIGKGKEYKPEDIVKFSWDDAPTIAHEVSDEERLRLFELAKKAKQWQVVK